MDDSDQKFHESVAADLFNRCWELIDQEHRTGDEEIEMLLSAMTSRWHWSQVGGPPEIATGDWQVAHAAALAGFADLSLAFASRNLTTAETERWTGWRLASAHEGMARACAVSGDEADRQRHLDAAYAALESEPDQGDRSLIETQLASVPATATT